MNTSDLSANVKRGAAWLDRERPGWWREVDISTLDLSDCSRCVLGQVFGNYQKGVGRGVRSRQRGTIGPWSEPHGFNGKDALKLHWVDAIMARRASDALAATHPSKPADCESRGFAPVADAGASSTPASAAVCNDSAGGLGLEALPPNFELPAGIEASGAEPLAVGGGHEGSFR